MGMHGQRTGRKTVNTLLLVGLGLALYVVFYHVYGRRLAERLVRQDPDRPTPAHRLQDGVDYVPTPRGVLFGHHFASIAGASPIVGPAIAMAWGWLPAILWIWAGNVFLGAVHDYLALMASVRNDGRSVQWVAGRLMSRRTGLLFQVFILFTLILIIAAFASIIAGLFHRIPEVATASGLFILSAVITGWLLYRTPLGLVGGTLVGLVLTAGSVWLGFRFPLSLSTHTWLLLLWLYAGLASSLPVWILLQPRDYLNAYLLWFGLALGALALLLGVEGFHLPAFTTWQAHVVSGVPSPFWPVVPLIIACGSLSGFHSIVASGTTSKQLNRETDGLFIGFGAMFTEGFLSTLVVAAIAAYGATVLANVASSLEASSVARSYTSWIGSVGGPVAIFARSYGLAVERVFHFSASLIAVFASLWVSAFALTTLDTTNRIGRFVVNELAAELHLPMLQRLFAHSRMLASFTVGALGTWLAWGGGWHLLWPAFGGANQMLASIALMTVALWVARELPSTRGYRLAVLLPALFLWVTVTAALLWYFIAVLPGTFASHPGQAVLLGGIVAVELLLNVVLFREFLIHSEGMRLFQQTVTETG